MHTSPLSICNVHVSVLAVECTMKKAGTVKGEKRLIVAMQSSDMNVGKVRIYDNNYVCKMVFNMIFTFSCFVLSYYITLCSVCYVMSCYDMLCCDMLCCVCYVMSCYVMVCYAMLCYIMSCYVMLCYVVSYYVVLQYILLFLIN